MFTFMGFSISALVAFATIAVLLMVPVTPPERAKLVHPGEPLNTPESDYTPYITPDERYLFFQSNREGAVGEPGDFDLWYSVNSNAGRGEPIFDKVANVGLPVNSPSLDGHPALRRLPDGSYEMYFASFASEARTGLGMTNLYRTVWQKGRWSEPLPVVEINTDFHDRMPSVSQDGRLLFFSSDRPGGRGADDIWVSVWDEVRQQWGQPQNAGNVNTAASEITPTLHSDGITLYFASNRKGGVGGFDLYVTRSLARFDNPNHPDILARGWTAPANLGKPYNSDLDDEYPSVTSNGKRVYFTSNRIGGRGSYDIYHALLPDFARPVSPVRLAGKTLLAGSLRPVPAEVVLSAGPVRAAFTTEAKSGYAFSVELLNQRRYQISAHAPGYRLLEAELDTSTFFPDTNQEWNLLFVRDVKIPASVSLLLRCLDKEQNPLSAELNYRIMAPQQRSGKVRCGEKILLLGPTSASRDNPAVFLELLQIELKSNPKGFAPWRETFALSPLWDAYPQQIPEVVEKTIVLEPRRTSGKTKTKKTKGKRP